MPYARGWRQDLEDHAWLASRQRHFDLARFRAVRTPDAIDPRPHLHVKNQGDLGSCSGFSRSTLEEVLNWIKTQGDQLVLSAMFAYLTNQKCCGCFGSDDGATIAGSVQAAGQYGICREQTFPYTGKYTATIPPESLTEGAVHLVKSHSVLSSYEEVWNYLATGTGVVQIGIPVTNGFENCTGVLTRKEMRGRSLGGHALAIVGYTSRKDPQGRHYPILVNSWGTDWGSQGTCEVEPALFDAWAQDNYSELIGISDLAAYEDGGSGRVDWIGDNPYAA